MQESIRPIRTSSTDRETYWRAECDAFNRRGGSLQSFCKERKIVYQTFCYWRKRLGEPKKIRKSEAEIQIPVLMPRLATHAPEIQVDVEGFVIKFPLNVNPDFLARVLLSMRAGGRC